jgi:hypothetical protein
MVSARPQQRSGLQTALVESVHALRSGAAVDTVLFEQQLRNGWLWLRPEGVSTNENFENLSDEAAQQVSLALSAVLVRAW